MNEDYKKEIDPLAIGLTRSPMFMGVNTKMFFGSVVFCALVCINAHTVMGVPLFIFLHLIMFRVSIKEPNFFSIYLKSFLKTPPVLNHWYWGKTNSYEPW